MLLYSIARNVVDLHINCTIIGATETKLGRWEADEWGMVERVARNSPAIR